jgi:hypothetical protein
MLWYFSASEQYFSFYFLTQNIVFKRILNFLQLMLVWLVIQCLSLNLISECQKWNICRFDWLSATYNICPWKPRQKSAKYTKPYIYQQQQKPKLWNSGNYCNLLCFFGYTYFYSCTCTESSYKNSAKLSLLDSETRLFFSFYCKVYIIRTKV